MKNAIICDIDGCLFDTAWIFEQTEQLGLTGEKKWQYFHQNINDFKSSTCEAMKNLITNVISKDTYILFITSRSEEIRFQTLSRIRSELPEIDCRFLLLMRPYGNIEQSDIVKAKLLELVIHEFNIVLAIDDDPSNCAMFESYNIPTLKWKINNNSTLTKEINGVPA